MDDANRPKAATRSKARAERDAWDRYVTSLRGVERQAFIDAVLGATLEQQDAAVQPWRALFLVEEALKAGPMCEALAVIENVSRHRPA